MALGNPVSGFASLRVATEGGEVQHETQWERTTAGSTSPLEMQSLYSVSILRILIRILFELLSAIIWVNKLNLRFYKTISSSTLR